MLKKIREFGMMPIGVAAFSRVMRSLKLPNRMIVSYVNWKNRYLSKWLWKHFSSVVVTEVHVNNQINENFVFVFWLQGEKKAPAIVKACIASVRKWCTDRQVVVLNKSNYSKYATLPNSLVQKYESGGGVSHAHFADVLRFYLLREHGGIWIDATDFLTMPIPKYVFDYSFYSLNGAYPNDLGWKWTSWFMAAKKGDLLVENMCRFYEAYWSKYDSAVTYLFLDCWILALYNHILAIKQNIDSLPDCGAKCYAIIGNWDRVYEKEEYSKIAKSFFVHKLTYKGVLPEQKVNGKLTMYGNILKTLE